MSPRPLALAATATVAVGLVRRWQEARTASRGGRPDPGPTTEEPVGGRDPVARWLAGWVPTPTATRWGQVAAATWAGPLTTVGGLAAALGGARARWDPQRGCWVATGVGGPSARLLALLGLHANTIGHLVLVRTERASPALLDHEAVHVRQGERLGPLLPMLYGVLSARHGYRDNPLERAARRGAAATGRP